MHPLVVNCHFTLYDVYVGRPSRWGNPFKVDVHGTREEVIEKYREWILTQPDLMRRVRSLRGKRLGCHCAPLPCHGEVIAELANSKRKGTR